jgi:hypothetical protein
VILKFFSCFNLLLKQGGLAGPSNGLTQDNFTGMYAFDSMLDSDDPDPELGEAYNTMLEQGLGKDDIASDGMFFTVAYTSGKSEMTMLEEDMAFKDLSAPSDEEMDTILPNREDNFNSEGKPTKNRKTVTICDDKIFSDTDRKIRQKLAARDKRR